MSLSFINKCMPKKYAEIGIAEGNTVLKVCEFLEKGSTIYLFDFKAQVENVFKKIIDKYGNKFKVKIYGVIKQNYNWDLIKLISKSKKKLFDYVYLDGSHDLTIDGLCFYLVDKLLEINGYIEFDDYNWTIAKSPSCSPYPPVNFTHTAELYTKEQIDTPQIKLIVDNLVKRDNRYKQIVENRIYQKIN